MPIFRQQRPVYIEAPAFYVSLPLIPHQAERTQRMKITWNFADGTTSEVEVNEELGNYITASRKEENSAERRHRRHCYSLDAILYEGKEYGTSTTPEDDAEAEAQQKRINETFSHLTEKQQQRLLMLADGLSCREIARHEGADYKSVYESIEAGKKKFKKFF
jgi:hypothetical protein